MTILYKSFTKTVYFVHTEIFEASLDPVERDTITPQQYSTNENPSLSRSNFLASLMHGHSDSS